MLQSTCIASVVQLQRISFFFSIELTVVVILSGDSARSQPSPSCSRCDHQAGGDLVVKKTVVALVQKAIGCSDSGLWQSWHAPGEEVSARLLLAVLLDVNTAVSSSVQPTLYTAGVWGPGVSAILAMAITTVPSSLTSFSRWVRLVASVHLEVFSVAVSLKSWLPAVASGLPARFP